MVKQPASRARGPDQARRPLGLSAVVRPPCRARSPTANRPWERQLEPVMLLSVVPNRSLDLTAARANGLGWRASLGFGELFPNRVETRKRACCYNPLRLALPPGGGLN